MPELKGVIRYVLVCTLVQSVPPFFADVVLADVASYIGTETWLACHDEMSAGFAASLHSKA